MKTIIVYEILIFLKYIFLKTSQFWMPYIRNIYQIYPSRNLLNGALHFGFTILFKKWAKTKKKMSIHFWEKKKKRKARQCYHDNICRWNRDGFSSEVEILILIWPPIILFQAVTRLKVIWIAQVTLD